MKDLIEGKGSPDTGPDHEIVSINNGQIAAAIKTMTGKNNQFGLTNDPAVTGSTDTNIYAPDAAHQNIVYLMPIFDKTLVGGDPIKFNKSAVVGAIAAKIKKVADSPGNYITIDIMGDGHVSAGVGGGNWYGVLATQPKLVE